MNLILTATTLLMKDEREAVISLQIFYKDRKHFRVLESRPVRSEFHHAATASRFPDRVVRKSMTRTVRKVPETDKKAAMSKQINMEEGMKAVADIEDDKWAAQVIDENAPTDLDKITQRALEAEVKQIFDKAMEVFPEKPSCEEDKVVVTRFRSDAGYRLAKAIAGNVAQRLLDIHNPLLVKLSFKSKPNPESFKAFLKQHRCCAIKRTHAREFVFAARMKTTQDLDNICALATAQCGNTRVTIKPAYKFTQAPPRLKYVFTRDCLSKKSNSQKAEITKKEKSNDGKSQETVKKVTEKVSEVKQIKKEVNKAIVSDKADKPEQTVKKEIKNITTPVEEEKTVPKEKVEKAKISPNETKSEAKVTNNAPKTESVKEANKTIVAKTQKSESDTTKTVQKSNETKALAEQNVNNENESDKKSIDTTTEEPEITTVKIVVNIKPSTDKTKKGNEAANKKVIVAPKTVEKEEKSSIDVKTEKPKESGTVTDKSKQSNNTVKAANADSKNVKETVTAQNIKSNETVKVETPNSKPAEKPVTKPITPVKKPAEKPVANPKTPVKKPTEKPVTKPQTPVKVTPTKTGVKKQQATPKTAQSNIKSPKVNAKKVNLKTASKVGDVNDKELSDNDELDDYDILAMMSEAIILDECGSDED